MSILTDAHPVAYRYRWKIDGEWTGWRVSDASQKSEHLRDLEEVPLYLATVSPPPSPDVAGVVERLRSLSNALGDFAECRCGSLNSSPDHHAQDCTFTLPAKGADSLAEAATLLESLSAEKGRLVEALTPFKEAADTHAQLQKDHKFLARERERMWNCLGIELADLDRARTALTPKEKA